MTFAELHVLSNYSFLRGASHPEELVKRAAELGHRAIALTDECSFAGLVKAHVAARDLDIQLIVGAEFHLAEGLRLVLLAPDRAAYGQLSALITRLRRRSPKGSYEARLEDFRWAIDGCLALWIPALEDIGALMDQGRRLKALFPQLWIALELFREATDLDKTAHALTLSMRLDLPIVASNDVHAHVAERQPLQDVLTAVRYRTTVSDIGSRGFQNAERHLRPLAELETLYPPEMLEEAGRIAGLCRFSLDELRYEYPQELVPPHLSPSAYLRQLTYAGAAERWPEGIPDSAGALVERELALIGELGFEYFFLTVQDIVAFARSQNILCQGRGSAANSAVCYCLHITEVDPSRMHLLFERFVNQERNEPPDIDVDFEHERREEVIQYIYRRYSRERAALAATLITYRPKSAIRDVGKALGMSADVVDLLAKSLAWWDNRDALAERFLAAGLDPHSEVVRRFRFFVDQILGFPRHLSQHVGGFVISRGPLAQLVPVENAAMAERTVIQWDKDDLEALGLLKVDVLGLGMLTAIRKALDALNGLDRHRRRGLPTANAADGESRSGDRSYAVATIPAEDPETYRMLQRGDSVGVFQVESRAQMAMLPRLKPRHFYDLVIEVAIVRPGPIQGDMVHPYLRRRQGLEPVDYPSDGVRRVLERTLGVPIFQEQVIELAVVAAGFTPGEADQLRRAMAAWKRRGGLGRFEQMIIDGMLARGHDRDFAERVFRQIEGFGEYGFPESHAASFALLVYVSAWLKCHEPAAFYCGLLNSLPMGFYSPSQLVQDAERHHIRVLPVDVQESTWEHRLVADASCDRDAQPPLRLGLRLARGLAEAAGQRIAAARPFADAEDLARRAGLDDRALRCLARAGALANLSGHRYQAHWEVAAIQRPLPLEKRLLKEPLEKQPLETQRPAALEVAELALPSPTPVSDMLDDYRYLGLSLGEHPLALLRADARLCGHLARCHTAAELERCRHGQFVRVAGLVTGRQRPGTASGVLFVTLEDDTGNVNLVVWSSVLEQFRAALLQGQMLRVKGVVEREQEVIHVIAGYVEDVTGWLRSLQHSKRTSGAEPTTNRAVSEDPGADLNEETPFRSRDFH
ncbi:MAG: error-prone DNA polymerase [Roseibium album]|uniref:error-prone DNA polymerase n=1 Tax=Roseibium album TaxID=311410 RepID=UPI0032F054E8